MWFNPGGNEMSDEEWASPFVRCLGMLLSGDTIDVLDFEGQPIRDDTFPLADQRALRADPVCSARTGTHRMAIDPRYCGRGRVFARSRRNFASGDDVEVQDRGAMLLKLVGGSQAQARKESWKKRQFEIPRESERLRRRRKRKRMRQPST